MSIHNRIASFDVRTPRSASEYLKTYNEAKEFATSQDEKEYDIAARRAGEVWLKSKQNDEFVSLSYQRDEGYVAENLNIYHHTLGDEGRYKTTEALQASHYDYRHPDKQHLIKFEHKTDVDGQKGYEKSQTFIVDTRTQQFVDIKDL